VTVFTQDLLERVLRTAIAAFASSLAVTQSYDKAAIATAVSAMLTAIFAMLASNFGDPDSASFFR
jgi:uncharacterized membrane protein YgaE (UPF0421/DUF939 family)